MIVDRDRREHLDNLFHPWSCMKSQLALQQKRSVFDAPLARTHQTRVGAARNTSEPTQLFLCRASRPCLLSNHLSAAIEYSFRPDEAHRARTTTRVERIRLSAAAFHQVRGVGGPDLRGLGGLSISI